MITLAASNIAWTKELDIQIRETLRETGISAIEAAPSRLFSDIPSASKDEAKELREFWEQQELPIVSMQALLFGRPELKIFGDTADTSALIDYLSHVIKLAGTLGAQPLVFGSPQNRLKGDLSFEQAKVRVTPLLHQLGDLCADANTVFCIEPNAVQYGCDFITTLEEAADVVNSVNHPHVALVADTGNMLLAGDTTDQLKLVMEYVAHVHISAPQLAPISSEEKFIRTVASYLKQSSYSRIVTLEMRSVNDNQAALLESANFLTQLFQSDAP